MDYGRTNNEYYRFCFSGHHFGSTMLNVNDTKEKPIKKSSAELTHLVLDFLVSEKIMLSFRMLYHYFLGVFAVSVIDYCC